MSLSGPCNGGTRRPHPARGAPPGGGNKKQPPTQEQRRRRPPDWLLIRADYQCADRPARHGVRDQVLLVAKMVEEFPKNKKHGSSPLLAAEGARARKAPGALTFLWQGFSGPQSCEG